MTKLMAMIFGDLLKLLCKHWTFAACHDLTSRIFLCPIFKMSPKSVSVSVIIRGAKGGLGLRRVVNVLARILEQNAVIAE